MFTDRDLYEYDPAERQREMEQERTARFAAKPRNVIRPHNFPYRITVEGYATADANGNASLQEQDVAYVECATPALAMAEGLAQKFPQSVVRVWEDRRQDSLLLKDFNNGR